jgi:hypothetical protein
MGVIICKNFILFLERLDQIKSACQQTGRTLAFCLLTHTAHFVPELTFRPLRSACGHYQQSSVFFAWFEDSLWMKKYFRISSINHPKLLIIKKTFNHRIEN